MTLCQLLFSQGFGTRRQCQGRIQHGQVRIHAQCITDPAHLIDDPTGLDFEVQGIRWRYQARAVIMLHKPTGFECSLKPTAWPAVHTLLPEPLRQRGVQCVGRLDQDTTGLLLLTDDGSLLHRLTSPKHQVPKVYEAHVKHPLNPTQIAQLCTGVTLHERQNTTTVRASAAQALDTHVLRLTVTEGKYHQVKRMVAAVGNRVERLHRSRVGHLPLPADLPCGQWRWVEDLQALLP